MINGVEKSNIPPQAEKPATPEEIAAYRGIIANTEKHFRELNEEEKENAPDHLRYLKAAALTDDDLGTGIALDKWRAENGRLADEKSREFLNLFHARWNKIEEDLRRQIKESLGEESDEDFLKAEIAEKLEEDPRYNFYRYLNRKIEERIKNGAK